MYTQYCVQSKRLDLYFPRHKLGLEIDEYRHVDRNFEDEQSKKIIMEEKRDCRTIRTDPTASDFNIYILINEVRMRKKETTIKFTKNSLIDDISKELLEATTELKRKCKKVGSKLIKKPVENVVPEYKKWLVKNMWKEKKRLLLSLEKESRW